MILLKYYFLLLISITVSVGAYATELYRTVDENGNVVFSDKKTHDAETIIVQPNVIDLDIPDMPESSSQANSKKQSSNNSAGAKQEMGGWNANNGSNLRRRARTETNGATSRPKTTPASGSRAGGR
ncbi:MAG: DUF4124 domain-containing protein [Proteobacteria bacterium]|nr:DUF4124 domain-containing protein [Pseudomonadota bacterium]